MTWDGHVEHLGEDIWRVLAGKPKGKKLLLELGVEGCIILKWSLKKKDVRAWTGFNWLRLGSSGRIL